MTDLTAQEAVALMAAGMYATPPTEAQMHAGRERAEAWLAAHDAETERLVRGTLAAGTRPEITPDLLAGIRERAEKAEAERDEAVAALDRVRALHGAVLYAGTTMPGGNFSQRCAACLPDSGTWRRWPCPTIRALGGGEGT